MMLRRPDTLPMIARLARSGFPVFALLGLGLGAWGCSSGTGALPGDSTSAVGGQAAVAVGTGGSGAGAASGGGGVGGGECMPTPELCNGQDDDCDGEVDENCPCVSGQQQACYSGDVTTNGVGVCQSGTQTCDESGSWGACDGEVLPSEEQCNGQDDDCDGEADDGFGQATCGVGACQVTVDECVDGKEQVCTPNHPGSETCNGQDDDCDGKVDEGCDCIDGQKQSCYTGSLVTKNVGTCKDGEQVCSGGKWGACSGDVTPTSELCDGLDNDCDGTPDDGNPESGSQCDTKLLGVCKAGTTSCQQGKLLCVQDVQASPEVCDGFDNNCDGSTDEGNPGGGQGCNTGLQGVCSAGTTSCSGGNIVCHQTVMASPEVCDGKDNNCNGAADDGNPESGQNCNTGLQGVCALGATSCINGGLVCNPNTNATAEICDGLDNDCNGTPDDGNPGGGKNCSTGLQGVCSSGTTVCSGGNLQCKQDVMSGPELCDGKDNDCDGTADEGNPAGGQSCNTGLQGVCATGTTNCSGGSQQCQQTTMSSAETCDGKDNDCDGATDENNPGGGQGCNTGLQGVCADGTTVCSGGGLQCNQDVISSAEICDGKDNDCDGQSDEGNPGGGQSCSTGQPGICAAGTTQCSGGNLGCIQNSPAAPKEICGNNLDDNCDGKVDEGCNVCSNQTLGTTFVSDNGLDGNMFDVTAKNTIKVLSFDGNFGVGAHTVEVYYRPGPYILFENSATDWTFLGSASVTSFGADNPTAIPVPVNVTIPAGQTYAFYVTTTSSGILYTDGIAEGSVYSQNSDLQILEGVGNVYPFGSIYYPRVWNGNINYEVCTP